MALTVPARNLKTLTVVVMKAGVLAIGLSGCAALQSGEIFKPGFWASAPAGQNTEAELGLAELAKGNFVTAEGQFNKALASDPRDIHALLGLGLLYQNNGQTTRAREMYEAILALRPDDSKQFVVWNNTQTRPIGEIASVNLALLESNGVLSGMESGMSNGMSGDSGSDAFGSGLSASGGGTSTALLGRGAPPGTSSMVSPGVKPGATRGNLPAGVRNGNAATLLTDKDRQVVGRFGTLAALRDQGLITPQEYDVRRQANVGALLPLTAPPPAAGLDRPVPDTEQISNRLRAIGRALEMRAMTVSQHANERSMILDALMPSAPVMVANPPPPPQGLMEAADS
ncbi:MAG: tetratricopeptide repeat protein, partial [Rhodospirillales bacterium]